MPAATTKQELQAVTKKEYDKLDRPLSNIDAKTATSKDDDRTSIKDTVAHRVHWIGLFIGWYTDGLAGKEVFFPAEGYNWGDLKRYNADLRTAQEDLDWGSARSSLEAANQQLVSLSRRMQTPISTAAQWQEPTTRGRLVGGQKPPVPVTTDRPPNTYEGDSRPEAPLGPAGCQGRPT